jgi:hypothetical protein
MRHVVLVVGSRFGSEASLRALAVVDFEEVNRRGGTREFATRAHHEAPHLGVEATQRHPRHLLCPQERQPLQPHQKDSTALYPHPPRPPSRYNVTAPGLTFRAVTDSGGATKRFDLTIAERGVFGLKFEGGTLRFSPAGGAVFATSLGVIVTGFLMASPSSSGSQPHSSACRCRCGSPSRWHRSCLLCFGAPD